MKKYIVLLIAIVVSITLIDSSNAARKKRVSKKDVEKTVVAKKDVTQKSGSCLMLADFNSGTAPNNIGGGLGAWDKDPNDETQGCKTSFISPGYGDEGYSLMLTYDVDSPNPAYNGFWMKLENIDVSNYSKISFRVKGDKDAMYTKRFKVELKNLKEMSPYYVDEITDDWTQIEIPLSYFYRISDWTKMNEFVIVFEDTKATQKTGIIYIDDISFLK